MASLTVTVVSPESTVFSGEARSLTAPAWDGKVGVLPGHAPMIALLGAGELAIDGSAGGAEVFHVAGGLIKIEADLVTVLTEYAASEPPSAELVKKLLGSQVDIEAPEPVASEEASNTPPA